MPQSPTDPIAPRPPRRISTRPTTGHDAKAVAGEAGALAALARDEGDWKPLLRAVVVALLPAMPRAVRSVAALLLRML